MTTRRQAGLPQEQIEAFAQSLLTNLRGLSIKDSLLVLSAAIRRVVRSDHGTLGKHSRSLPIANLKRRSSSGRVSKIESDPEVQRFIHELKRYHTYSEIEQFCITAFGVKRAPRKSSIGRYIQKITAETTETDDAEPKSG